MEETYNFYIDESCHLEHDNCSVMCIGYTKINKEEYAKIKTDIQNLKLKYKSPTELKWAKLSNSRWLFYKELIDYFFKNNVHFRAVLVKNKKNINNSYFNADDHGTFYNKVVYLLLNNTYVNNQNKNYWVYLDIKDTRGKQRLIELQKYLNYKFSNNQPFKFFQHIRSNENELLQLTDFLIGALTYKARKEYLKDDASEVKKKVIEYIEEKSGYSIDEGTEPWAKKFNIFDFQISAAK